MEKTHRQKVKIISFSVQDNCEPKILQKPFIGFSSALNHNSFKIIVVATLQALARYSENEIQGGDWQHWGRGRRSAEHEME